MNEPLTNDDLLHRLRKRIGIARIAGSNVSLHPDQALALVECAEALEKVVDAPGTRFMGDHWTLCCVALEKLRNPVMEHPSTKEKIIAEVVLSERFETMADELPEEMTYSERLVQAKATQVGDCWRKKKTPDRWAEVLATDGTGNLRLRHWNGRVTRKWYSYLASDYIKVIP